MRRAKSASSLTGGHDQKQNAWTEEEEALQTGVLGGRRGAGRGKSHLNMPGLGAQTLSQQATSGRAQGLDMNWEGAKFDLGFCGLYGAL